jgi:hypothetical protein
MQQNRIQLSLYLFNIIINKTSNLINHVPIPLIEELDGRIVRACRVQTVLHLAHPIDLLGVGGRHTPYGLHPLEREVRERVIREAHDHTGAIINVDVDWEGLLNNCIEIGGCDLSDTFDWGLMSTYLIEPYYICFSILLN